MYNLNKRVILYLTNNNEWLVSRPEEERKFIESKEVKQLLSFKMSDYNNLVGFIGYEKNNQYMVFKVKNMSSKRDTGARCDEAGKIKTINTINDIMGFERFNKNNTKQIKEKGIIITEAIKQSELCIYQELILRYYEEINKDGKKWFLTPELALLYKFYTVFIQK
jgi:hypothetical protein